METISIRLEEDFAKTLSKVIAKHMYSTKTEFIREAIRDKIKEIEREELLKKAYALAGSSKKKTSDEELHKVREKLKDFYEKKLKIK